MIYGILQPSSRTPGRWEVVSRGLAPRNDTTTELTSGDQIRLPTGEGGAWEPAHVEHDYEKGYVAVGKTFVLPLRALMVVQLP